MRLFTVQKLKQGTNFVGNICAKLETCIIIKNFKFNYTNSLVRLQVSNFFIVFKMTKITNLSSFVISSILSKLQISFF